MTKMANDSTDILMIYLGMLVHSHPPVHIAAEAVLETRCVRAASAANDDKSTPLRVRAPSLPKDAQCAAH
jgi:hypothetical protein